MVHETIQMFSWEVETFTDDEEEVTGRTLHIDVVSLAVVPLMGQMGPVPQQVPVKIKRISIPFEVQTATGVKMYELLSAAMRGEELPPPVQIAKDMPKLSPIILPPNGKR